MKKIVTLISLHTFLYSQSLLLPDTYIYNDIVEESNITKNINRVEIEKNSNKRIDNILREIGSVEVRGDKIDIRGMGEGMNTKLYLDNIPLNSFDMSLPKLNYLNMGDVGEVEVLYGAGSVLYGDGAMGGVVNIKRNSIEALEVNNTMSYTKDSFNGSTFDLSAGTFLFNEKVSFQTNYLNKDTDGYRKNNYEEVEKLEVTTKYIINPYEVYTLSLGNIDSAYGLPGSIGKTDDNKESFYKEDFFETEENNLLFSYKNTYNSKLNFFFDTSYSQKEYYSESNFWGKSTRSVDGSRIFLRPKLVYNYGFASNLILAYDFSYEENTIEQISTSIYKSENEKSTNALYFYNTYATDLVDYVSGFRYEQSKYNQNGTKEVFDNTAFDIGSKYYYGVEGNIFLNFSTAFRTPNIDELSYASTPLTSQKSYNFDLGISEKRGNNLVSIGFFTIITEDEIFFDPRGNNGHGSNVNMQGKNLRVGAEYTNERRYNKLTVKDSVTLIDTRILDGDYVGKSVPGVAPINYKINANYNLSEDLKLWLSGLYTNSYYHYGDYENSYEKVDYTILFHMGIDYDYENFKIFGGIDNITDAKYYDYAGYSNDTSYYYPGQGRRFYMGLKAIF